ncbi:MAG: C4-type zinc ribbon domain-containing protein [Nitrospirota bacterium]
MKEQIKYLVELQQIDSKIFEKKSAIDRIPLKMADTEASLREAQKELDELKRRHESIEKKRREEERELDDVNQKIKKLKDRTAEIKTNKEYQAHLREIEAAEKERYAVEDEILNLMEAIEASSSKIKSGEAKLKAERDKSEASKRELQKEMKEAEKEFMALKEARTGFVNKIDREIYDIYIALLESANGLAVTEAREEVCQGCNMNIPPQLFVEIKRNEEIIHCPQCHRILYYKNNN